MDEIAKEGQNIRKYYQQRLPSNPKKDYYFMHRDTPDNETIIVEYGFVDSNKDDVNQIKKDYEKYAEAVVRAVADYKGIKYIPPTSSDDIYIVQKGDSLWSIANKFGLTVNELKELNNLSTNILKTNQVLKVKMENKTVPNDLMIYQVKSGDSLWSIASDFNTTVNNLKNINKLTSDVLTINQELLVPKNTTTSSSDLKYQIYTVEKGDNLYNIANKYGTTVNNIMSLNNLSTTVLSIGQSLKIPTTSSLKKYIVQKGDSLWKIANKFGTTINKLLTLNNLKDTTLQINQELLIP